VRKWAESLDGIDAEDAAILGTQKINGEALLKLTEDKLMQDGMPRGPASALMGAVNALLAASVRAKNGERRRILLPHATHSTANHC